MTSAEQPSKKVPNVLNFLTHLIFITVNIKNYTTQKQKRKKKKIHDVNIKYFSLEGKFILQVYLANYYTTRGAPTRLL